MRIEKVEVTFCNDAPIRWLIEYVGKKSRKTIIYYRIDEETGEYLPFYGDELPKDAIRFCMINDSKELSPLSPYSDTYVYREKN